MPALGLDETLYARQRHFRTQVWSTQIVDVRRGQLRDVVPGRNSVEPCRWLAAQPQAWRDEVRWATLDLSSTYRSVFDTMRPDAVQVADPFHVVKLANEAVDECRRRVQNETECDDDQRRWFLAGTTVGSLASVLTGVIRPSHAGHLSLVAVRRVP